MRTMASVVRIAVAGLGAAVLAGGIVPPADAHGGHGSRSHAISPSRGASSGGSSTMLRSQPASHSHAGVHRHHHHPHHRHHGAVSYAPAPRIVVVPRPVHAVPRTVYVAPAVTYVPPIAYVEPPAYLPPPPPASAPTPPGAWRPVTGPALAVDGASFVAGGVTYVLSGIRVHYPATPQGAAARARLQELLSSGQVAVWRIATDGYGRAIARVVVNGADLSVKLRQEGFAAA